MKIALTNLGKYNQGVLDFVWLTLPATDKEIAAAFDKIEVSHDDTHYYSDGCGHIATNDYYGEYEEYFITDYECDFYNIGEYENLETLNEIAETIDGLTDDEAEIVKALMEDGEDLEEAINNIDRCILYSGCDSMLDVAYEIVDNCGMLDRMPEDLQSFCSWRYRPEGERTTVVCKRNTSSPL